MTHEISSIRSICVYCGSRPGRNQLHIKAGLALGQNIAEHQLRLVYGGGTKGVMGAVAEGALAAGGRVTGIIPEFLIEMEANRQSLQNLDELIITPDMHARKHTMFERSDAFVALPGGIGTLEEIVEIMTWAQLGRHQKPMIFANINGFWDPMMELIRHMTDEGFLHTAHLVQPLIIDDVADIVPAILAQGEHKSASQREGEPPVIARM